MTMAKFRIVQVSDYSNGEIIDVYKIQKKYFGLFWCDVKTPTGYTYGYINRVYCGWYHLDYIKFSNVSDALMVLDGVQRKYRYWNVNPNRITARYNPAKNKIIWFNHLHLISKRADEEMYQVFENEKEYEVFNDKFKHAGRVKVIKSD